MRVDCQSYLSLLEINMKILGSIPVVSRNYLVFGKLQTFPLLVEVTGSLGEEEKKNKHRNRSQLLSVS